MGRLSLSELIRNKVKSDMFDSMKNGYLSKFSPEPQCIPVRRQISKNHSWYLFQTSLLIMLLSIQMYCFFLFTCNYLALIVTYCFKGLVKSL